MGKAVGDTLPLAIGVAISPVPVIGYVAARDRVTAPLDDLRDWLTDNNATVVTVLLLVIGAVILGQGVAGL